MCCCRGCTSRPMGRLSSCKCGRRPRPCRIGARHVGQPAKAKPPTQCAPARASTWRSACLWASHPSLASVADKGGRLRQSPLRYDGGGRQSGLPRTFLLVPSPTCPGLLSLLPPVSELAAPSHRLFKSAHPLHRSLNSARLCCRRRLLVRVHNLGLVFLIKDSKRTATALCCRIHWL